MKNSTSFLLLSCMGAAMLVVFPFAHEKIAKGGPMNTVQGPFAGNGEDGQKRITHREQVPAVMHGLTELRKPTDPGGLERYFRLRARPEAKEKYLPEPYDLDAVNRDPGYYERVDYTRLRQRMGHAPDREPPPLVRVSLHHQMGAPNETVPYELIVEAAPGRPVTFWAPSSGAFPNGEPLITVRSDPRMGLARTRFAFGPGPGTYHVYAFSPENSGQAFWIMECTADQDRISAWRRKMDSSIEMVNPRSPVILKPDGLLIRNENHDPRPGSYR